MSLGNSPIGDEAQFRTIWEAAKERYVATTKKDIDASSLAKVVDIHSLRELVDNQNASFKTYRKKRDRLWHCLDIMCRPLAQVESIAGAAAEGFPPANACVKAVMLFINAANGVSESYDAVADLLEVLGDLMIRIQIYHQHSLPPGLLTKLVEILATLLDILARSTKIISDGDVVHRLLSFGKNILLGSDKTLQKLLKHFERLIAAESRLIGAETYSTTRHAERRLQSISTGLVNVDEAVRQGNRQIDSMSSDMRQLHVKQDELIELLRSDPQTPAPYTSSENLKAILQPSTLSEDRFQSIDRSRVPGTADWIHDQTLFQKWQAGVFPTLWLCGNPGHGKSYVCSKIVSSLKSQAFPNLEGAARASVAYFFFRAASPETSGILNALRTMAFQLSQSDLGYSGYIHSCTLTDTDFVSISGAWRALFVNYFLRGPSPADPTYLVFDGLDEAFDDERLLFLELLQDLSATENVSRPSLRILLSGRLQVTDEVHDALGEGTATIQVDRVKNEKDIENYVRSRIQKSRTLRSAPVDIRSLILDTIIAKADGMFLWCDLMMQQLSMLRRTSSIKEALQSIPKGLEDMLAHVLETISATCQPEDAEDLNEIIRWVAVASNPLHLGELSAILASATPDGAEPLDLEGQLRTRYACFFILNRPDGMTTEDLLAKFATKAEKDTPQSFEEMPGDVHSWLESLKDEQPDSPFNSDPAETTVTFCHASIGQYFRTSQHLPISYEGRPAIGIDANDVKAYVLARCSEILCKIISDIDRAHGREDIPFNWNMSTFEHIWTETLQDTSKVVDTLKTSTKIRAGRSISPMFLDDTVLEITCLYRMAESHCSYRTALRTWYMDETVLNSLEGDCQAWALAGIERPSNFLLKMKQVCARLWLKRPLSHAINFKAIFETISAIMTAQIEDGDPRSTELECDNIVQVARSFRFEEDARWHCALGAALSAWGDINLALEHLRKAAEMGPGDLITAGYLAGVFWDLDEIDYAIQTLLGALTISAEEGHARHERSHPRSEWRSKSEARLISSMYEFLGELYYGTGQSALASDAFLKANAAGLVGRKPSLVSVAGLGEANYHLEIIRILEQLESQAAIDAKEGRLGLARWFIGISPEAFSPIRQAAILTNRVEWLEGLLVDAAKLCSTASPNGPPHSILLNLALLYRGSDQHEKAAFLVNLFWRDIVKNQQRSHTEHLIQSFADFCLKKALQHACVLKSQGTTRYIKELEFFWESGKSVALQIGSGVPKESVIVALNLSRWYRFDGSHDKMRDCMRETIRFAFRDRAWTPTSNEKLFQLRVLVAAGEDTRATSFAHSIATSEQQRSGLKLSANNPVWTCAGVFCGSPRSQGLASQNVLVCRFCGTILCQPCHTAFLTSNMRVRGCYRYHDWLDIPSRPPQAMHAGTTFYEDREVSDDEFNAGLKGAWGL